MRYKKTYKKDSINKFDIFDFVILKDKELTIVEKNHFLQKFSKAQLHYSSFRKLAKLFKLKRYREFEIDTDLCFQPFSNLNKSMLISLLENNILYKFRISDLINIANKSLSHSPYFFAEPCSIKNPYTNIPFSTANLYNLYFKIQETNYIMPFLFHLYFVSDFNLNKFKNENECYIREAAINNFIINSSIDEQHEYILKMFYSHYNCILFRVDTHFPKHRLVAIFKKFLKPFLLEEYSLNPYVKELNKAFLEYNLTLFSQLNPDFGKKLWIRKRRQNQSILCHIFNEHVIESSNLVHNSYTISPRVLSSSERENTTISENNIVYHNHENNTIYNLNSRQNNVSILNGTVANSLVDYAEHADSVDDENDIEEDDEEAVEYNPSLDDILHNYGDQNV